MNVGMNGRDYVALRRLSNAADETLAHVNETCERVPASSLPLLLASGKIAPVVQKPDAPALTATIDELRMTLDDGTAAIDEVTAAMARVRQERH